MQLHDVLNKVARETLMDIVTDSARVTWLEEAQYNLDEGREYIEVGSSLSKTGNPVTVSIPTL